MKLKISIFSSKCKILTFDDHSSSQLNQSYDLLKNKLNFPNIKILDFPLLKISIPNVIIDFILPMIMKKILIGDKGAGI